MAAQLTLTSGPAARALQAWMTSASTSLPTPLSPVIRMRLSEAAISEASWKTACISGLLATTCAGNCLSALNFSGRGLGDAGGLLDGGEQFVQVNRLGQVIERAVAHGADGLADVGVGGHQQDRQDGMLLARAPQRLQARQARHAHVGDHHADVPGAEDFQGRFARGDR